jgi:hypothetical protein
MHDGDYGALRTRLAASLKRDAALHRLGQPERIGLGYAALRAALLVGRDQRRQKLGVALDFWDAWITARDTRWAQYDHVPMRLWPTLALVVAGDLDADRDITDQRVRLAYDLSMTFQLPPSVLQSHLAGVSDGTRGAAEHAVG